MSRFQLFPILVLVSILVSINTLLNFSKITSYTIPFDSSQGTNRYITKIIFSVMCLGFFSFLCLPLNDKQIVTYLYHISRPEYPDISSKRNESMVENALCSHLDLHLHLFHCSYACMTLLFLNHASAYYFCCWSHETISVFKKRHFLPCPATWNTTDGSSFCHLISTQAKEFSYA